MSRSRAKGGEIAPGTMAAASTARTRARFLKPFREDMRKPSIIDLTNSVGFKRSQTDVPASRAAGRIILAHTIDALPPFGFPPMLSLVVATKGRAAPLQALFESLQAQSFRDFEVIVVDQNVDARVGSPETEGWSFPVTHLRTPDESGASRARNAGFAAAHGSVVLFPDDDCWYPPNFLEAALRRMEAHGADVLAGRAAAADGRDINGRFEPRMMRIDRANVWTTGIEWVVFFKRHVLAMTCGYDEEIGIGAATPWQSCEAQDIMLRALRAGYVCVFDPEVYGHHAELDIRSAAMRKKGRAYARGLGFVLRRHRFSSLTAMNWIARPIARAALSTLRGEFALSVYYANVAVGRFEGWHMKTLTPRVARVSTEPRGMSALRG